MKKITVLLPKPQEPTKLRVAAYCRVSTLTPLQKRSLEQQIKAYTEIISENPDWILAGVFDDAGKSGVRSNGRIGLGKLLKKAASR